MILVPVDRLPAPTVTMFQLGSIFLIVLCVHLASSFPLLPRRNYDGNTEESHWVNIWTTMPQLVEPANLPPVPFVCLISLSGVTNASVLTAGYRMDPLLCSVILPFVKLSRFHCPHRRSVFDSVIPVSYTHLTLPTICSV